jgi:peptidoglycan-associated lipoprotein
MCLSQNNKRMFITIVLGMFLVSGCSGHSVKYGANSAGEGMASEGEMTEPIDGVSYGTARHADGSTMHGGTVHGNSPYLQSGQGSSDPNSAMTTEMGGIEGAAIVPGSGSDYGQQFGGVDGSGPNQGGITGFGNGSANASNPDPETWANAYLREKGSNQGFYGDPANAGSLSNGGNASSMKADPEKWAKAYEEENGGPSPEYVNPDMGIALANEKRDSLSMGIQDSNEEFLNITNTSRGAEGRLQDIYFAFDSWSISTEGAKYLEEDAKWLHANPAKALTIEGHCDQRGTQDYNLVLGKKRAETAREYLVNLGVQPHRIKIVSYGKERPFCQNNNENCFQENRRNHMVVRMNQS